MTKTFKFYGIDNNCYKLDNTVWEAIEDPSDGYRSYLGSIELKENTDNLIFFSDSLADVFVKDFESNNERGFKLIDVKDNHEWLKVGTGNTDDYYPYFMFTYIPKPPKLTWNQFISE